MRPIRFFPDNTTYDFVRLRLAAFAFSLLLVTITGVSLAVNGLNFGIDFKGGVLVEVQTAQPIDIPALRNQLAAADFSTVEVQQFNNPREALIRVDSGELGTAAASQVVPRIRAALGAEYEFRRTELVGPRVSGELLRDGALATLLAIAAIAVYVWFRFEWQFGVSAMIATAHDVVVTIGLLSVTQLEFNLTAVAALLTLAGYSINDTVVVFDRMRELLRRHKRIPLGEIINLAVNQTMSRTLLTSGTTLAAILPLLFFTTSTLLNFTVSLVWGILIGTFSSIFVAAALLLYLPPLNRATAEDVTPEALIENEGR
ncbi:MAG: protein translocase subunit SecF [Alphaproteobacteria bacterium]|nr:protein translocase subunit SecF [Alphaproteobacteria bacterium]MBU0796393.1 protein translocase subunit SecF [Alphaproteobacteria bacterium]MBU0886744.1 protein translocase subunit SecF [Alphaproteobacteria bacterium]MBU1812643.1 protein translocase subunit SecF [Alphaproteobacteria bacterium]